MLSRLITLAGLLSLSGCAYDAGYYQSGYSHQPNSIASYYPADYTPYLPSSPIYGSPYVGGPVIGGIYSTGDSYDVYGGPVFSPFHGISCDRRLYFCWGRNGPDSRWSTRFFGRRDAHWNSGAWHSGHWQTWHNGNGNHAGWNGGHGNHGGANPGGNNPNGNQPWVYRMPQDPDGSGTPSFMPNGN